MRPSGNKEQKVHGQSSPYPPPHTHILPLNCSYQASREYILNKVAVVAYEERNYSLDCSAKLHGIKSED